MWPDQIVAPDPSRRERFRDWRRRPRSLRASLAVLALSCVMGLAGAVMAIWGLERGNQPHYYDVPIEFLPPVEGTLTIPRDMQPAPPAKADPS